MGKLFEINPTTSARRKKKYPYKIKFSDGCVVPVPSQHDFADKFIQSHGCSLAGFYMALRFVGKKKSMEKCYAYMRDHYNLNGKAKYSLRQVCAAINKLAPENPAKFYEKISKAEMKKALKRGDMVLFEEKNPIHTAVILWNGRKFKRFSDGRYKTVTVDWEIRKRCGDDWYGGCVIIRKPN